MDEERFWKIVANACRSDPHKAEEWDARLQGDLEKLAPDEIIEWNHIFDRLAARAYAVDLWGAAYLINGPEGRMVCIDGMSIASCCLFDGGMQQLACLPYRPAVAQFVADMIHPAWQACRVAAVRNALDDCGRYVGLSLSRDPIPKPPEVTSIAVIGTPADGAEFLEMIRTARHR